MNNRQIDTLLDKLASGGYSPAEEQQGRAFIHRYHMEGPSGLTDEDFLEAETEMWTAIEKAGRPKVRRMPLWKPAIAAAVAVIMFGAGLFYFNRAGEADLQTGSYANDIAPGKQGATLTLANGKKIRLSDAVNGELAKEAGVVITKSAGGQLVYEIKERSKESNAINALSTAAGETYQVRLPDGSLVTLNAVSSLAYPANFTALKQRRVKLSGEGYFEIAKDKHHPFVVESRGQEVEVLGTHFNIYAYPDEASTRTTLLEGSVRIAASALPGVVSGSGRNREDITLKPGQQAEYENGRMTVNEVNAEGEVAWKEGYFRFNNESLEEVISRIARWYNIKVLYEDQSVKQKVILGSVSRYAELSKVIRVLERTDVAIFKLEGRTLKISKKK